MTALLIEPASVEQGIDPNVCQNRVRPKGSDLPFRVCGEVAFVQALVRCTVHDGLLALPLCVRCLARLQGQGASCRKKCPGRPVVLVAMLPAGGAR